MTVVAQVDHSQNPSVIQMVIDYGDDEVPQEIQKAQQETPPRWIDVTDVSPRPSTGWLFDGTNFTKSSAQTNQETITANIQAAIAQNITYMAITAPTATQQVAQVKRLTQQVNAIARMMAGQFDATT